MARINIEDSLFKDSRFIDLCIHFKDKQKSLGCLVWAFIVAQKHYLNEENDRLIPYDEWKTQGCDDVLINLGFAEKKDNGIYVCGSEKQFAWLIQRVEAGRKGGIGGREIYRNMTDEQRKLREKARKAIANAVQRKRIIKPEVCNSCGVSCNPEAHHSDYSKPFDVLWVCKKCHHEIHDQLRSINTQGNDVSFVNREEAVAKRTQAVAKPLNSLLLSPTLISSSSSDSSSNLNNILQDEKEAVAKRTQAISTKASKAALCGCISELAFDPDIVELMCNVKQETQKLWLSLYKNPQWIIFELKKAKGWMIENPAKAPKSQFGKFYNNWLSSGFERYRKTIQSNNVAKGNWVEEHNRRAMQQIEDLEAKEREVSSES